MTATATRAEDIFRHLEDLRTGTYEGAAGWEERVARFRRGIELLDPAVRRVLDETNTTFLDGTGSINHRSGEDRDGGVWAHWELSWPEQRATRTRDGGRVPPVQVIATFLRATTHPHLSGSGGAMWPCQVTDADDAQRQESILRAIVEAELHQRIFQGTWRVVPGFVRNRA